MAFPTTLPLSTATPLRGGPTLRWGILAPGAIANDWVTSVHANSDQRVVAVGSRSAERGAAFAAEHGIPRSYDSYEALVGDPEVDIVYVSSPHSHHRELALLAIAAGKHVLVEKPIGVSAAEARQIAAAARAAGVFAMEAVWTRFLPQSTVIKTLLDDGVLGDLQIVTAELGFAMPVNLEGRMYNPALGGGAMLDLGVYPVWFSHFALGAPDSAHTFGTLTSTGVDAQAAVGLEYPNGVMAQFTTSMLAQTRNGASIAGTLARIDVDPMFIAPTTFSLVSGDDERLEWADPEPFPFWRDGLVWQAAAVAQHVADGLTEAPEHPLDQTIAQLETIDSVRMQLGYPPQ